MTDFCVIPSDFDGPGQYRVLVPARELVRRGHRVCLPRYEVLKALDGNILRWDVVEDGVPDADTYIVQNPHEPHWPNLVKWLRARGKRVVFESDDSHLGFPAGHPAALTDWSSHFRAAGVADRVVVSTPALAEQLSRFNSDVRVVPNFLDWELWESVPLQFEQSRRRVRVGWMGVLKWHRWDVELLRGVIGPWLERNPQVEFVAAGDSTVHDLLGVPYAQRVSTDRVSFHERSLPLITATFDVGLVPLLSCSFNECKSYLKGLEYAACGIPVVASPTGEYRGFVRDGVDGFLARRPVDWLRALDVLVNDFGVRRDMGVAARAKAMSMTVQEHSHLWEDAYAF